jgi:hypothetical protein
MRFDLRIQRALCLRPLARLGLQLGLQQKSARRPI